MFIVTIWTTALLMFIHCKMAPGTHATENQAAGSVVLRLRHRLENLSWEMNDHLHPVPHVENLSWKMNPASSEKSYDGHVVSPSSTSARSFPSKKKSPHLKVIAFSSSIEASFTSPIMTSSWLPSDCLTSVSAKL